MTEGDSEPAKNGPGREERRGPFVVRWLRRLAVLLAAGAVLLGGLYATRERTLHPLLVRILPAVSRGLTPYEVHVEDIDGDWRNGLALTGLRVERRDEAQPLVRLEAERVEVRGALVRLARTADLAALDSAAAIAPRVTIDVSAGGASEPSGAPLELPALPRLDVERGALTILGLEAPIEVAGLEAHGAARPELPLELSASASSTRWSGRVEGAVTLEATDAVRFHATVEELVARGVEARATDVVGVWSPGRLAIETGAVELGGNRVVARGIEVDTRSGEPLVRGDAHLELSDVAEAQRVLVALELVPEEPRWSGAGSGDVHLEPAPGHVTKGAATLELDDVAYGDYRAGTLRVTGDTTDFTVTATTFRTPLGWLGEIARITIDGDLGPGRLALDAVDADLVHGHLVGAVDLEFATAEDPFALEVRELRLDKGTDHVALARPARIAFPADGVRIDDLALGGTSGALEASIVTNADGGVTASAVATGLDLTPFVPGLDPDSGEFGLADAKLRLTSIDGRVDFESEPFTLATHLDLSADVRRQDTIEALRAHVEGTWNADGANLRSVTVDAGGAHLRAEGELALAGTLTIPVDAALRLDATLDTGADVARAAAAAGLVDPELGALLARIDGRAEVALRLGGTWSRVTGTATVTSDRLRLRPQEGGAALPYLDRPATIAVSAKLGDAVTLEESTVRLGEVLTADVSGSIAHALSPAAFARDPAAEGAAWRSATLDGRVDFTAHSLDELAKLVPELRETGGELTARLDLDGPLGAPTPTGVVRLANGTARYRGAPPIEKAHVELAFEKGQIVLQRGDLDVGSAPVSVEGFMLLGQGNPTVDASVRGEDVLLVRSRDARLRADLDLALTGRLADLKVGGSVVVTDGRVRSPIEFQSLLEGGGVAPPSVSRGLRLPALGPESVDLDLRVRTAEPIGLDGRIARGGVRAELQLVGTAAEPRPVGSVFFDPLELAVPAGTIEFTSGLVTFSPDDPEIPTLDLVGDTRLAGYDVTISVSGEYDRAEVELSSSPALPPDDLLLLVLTGQPPAAGTGLGAAGQSVALYVAKDLVRGWFSSGSFEDADRESFLDRLEVTTGRDVSRAGVLTIEATYKLREGLARKKDALYVVLERDAYEDYGLGLRLVLRLD